MAVGRKWPRKLEPEQWPQESSRAQQQGATRMCGRQWSDALCRVVVGDANYRRRTSRLPEKDYWSFSPGTRKTQKDLFDLIDAVGELQRRCSVVTQRGSQA